MTSNITPAGYIIQDRQGNAIYGTGQTVDEAWMQVVADAGPFLDAYGNAKDDEAAFVEDFTAYGATAELLALIEERGGDIAWRVLGGVACTVDQAEASH